VSMGDGSSVPVLWFEQVAIIGKTISK